MKVLLTLLLALLGSIPLLAQKSLKPNTYTDPSARFQLRYPATWQLRRTGGVNEVTFYAGGTASAVVSLTVEPVPGNIYGHNPLVLGQADTLWRRLRRLPRAQVRSLDAHDAGTFQEISYDYTFLPPGSAGRRHVVGRQLWRRDGRYQAEYQAPATAENAAYLAEARELLSSFEFIGSLPVGKYAALPCDDKMYGIAALRVHDGNWEDDCRTIHEFSTDDPSAPPRIHRDALPFQAYALTKGFDNCLYSVTKAPTNRPELVYRYNPATRQGEYTSWLLPAQGEETVWISAATDERGDLLFSTADGNQLIRVNPEYGTVAPEWRTDPVRQADYYPLIGYEGAGTHANFCLDDTNTLYEVCSNNGALLTIDMSTQQPSPRLITLAGLPKQGGYSGLLMQYDAAGRYRVFLAGQKALYKVDLARRQATLVRRGTYTDLAGCNLFAARADAPTPPAPPKAGQVSWQGRVLDAVTLQPLPAAQLRMHASRGTISHLSPTAPEALLRFAAEAGQTYDVQVQLAGYLPADTTYVAHAGTHAQDILLQPLTVGTTLRLENVRFEQGQAILLPSSYPALDRLVALLKSNPGLTIELRGHTDNVGDPRKNLGLSRQRVAIVKGYLTSRGVAERRITGLGFGGDEPIASNDDETTRQLNRRVEFRVTGVQ